MIGFTYLQLVDAMKGWPQNQGNEYVGFIPRFVEMGELRLIRDLNLDIFDQVDSTYTLLSGTRQIPKPIGLIQLRSMRLALIAATVNTAALPAGLVLSAITSVGPTITALNGSLGPSPAVLAPARQVTVTQTIGAGGVNVKINGLDSQGFAAVETLVSVTASTVIGTIRFGTISSVTVSNGSAGQTISVGTASVSANTLGKGAPVLRRSWDFCQNFSSDPAVVGKPRYFNELNEAYFELAQAADQNYAAVLHFVKRPQSIVVLGSSWLGDRCGDLLLACSLMEAEHYLKADDRYADMKDKYYSELLPTTRAELRDSIRRGDYSPMQAAASKAS